MFKVEIKGLKNFEKQFLAAPAEIKKLVAAEVENAAQEWTKGARADVPIDQGALKSAITYFMRSELQAEVVAQKFYAPFMEFGTKGKYRPIEGTEAIAAAFKGYKGGDFMDLLRNIVRWLGRKGKDPVTARHGTYSVKTRKRSGSKVNQIAEDYAAAWPIAMSILKYGVKPHPFFFKQREIVWPKMIDRIEKQLKSSTGVSVIMPGDIKRPKIVTI